MNRAIVELKVAFLAAHSVLQIRAMTMKHPVLKTLESAITFTAVSGIAGCAIGAPGGTDDPNGDPSVVHALDQKDGGAGSSAGGDRASPAQKQKPRTKIEHVVLIVQENKTFDAYFGRYCTSPPRSSPSCTEGPTCCEGAPTREPSGSSPILLTDSTNGLRDPNHKQSCELAQINNGAMDQFVSGADCSHPSNFALADDNRDPVASLYHEYASSYALADRYFQPLAGPSAPNSMYFATARFVFGDSVPEPNAIGSTCSTIRKRMSYEGKTSADLLTAAGYDFSIYAEGYQTMATSLATTNQCPTPPSECGLHLPIHPCTYDPLDIPFSFYSNFADNPDHMKDFSGFSKDIASGNLPAFAFVKALGYKSEHSGLRIKISDGVKFVKETIDSILTSEYRDNTLILLTWDEGGGFYDHVPPPANSKVDNQPYGTRVPFLAIGRFAKRNHISHVTLEHSSIVKFLEFNFLGETGQLHGRDAVVNNIGSLLDPVQTGTAVPSE